MLKAKAIREYYKRFLLPISGDNIRNSHGVDHCDDVFNLMIKLNDKLSYGYSEEIIAFAAYIHDMYSDAENRKIHHILAHTYVLNRVDDLLKELSEDDLYLIANAVLEHRASYKGEFSSNLSTLISAADRGVPDYDSHYNRSLVYNDGDHKEVIEHLVDKFGRDGYATKKYPKFYSDMFKEELEEFWNRLDKEATKL